MAQSEGSLLKSSSNAPITSECISVSSFSTKHQRPRACLKARLLFSENPLIQSLTMKVTSGKSLLAFFRFSGLNI